jgi:PEP-CTERM motif
MADAILHLRICKCRNFLGRMVMQMKAARLSWVVLALVLVCGCPAFAGEITPQDSLANPLIVVNESGIGTMTFPGEATYAMAGILQNDPGPGGLHQALTFDLFGPPSLVAGDVVLFEGGEPGDLIRFNPAGTGSPSYVASLVFYSEAIHGSDILADTGLPHKRYDNLLQLDEIGGAASYTPNPGQPGYVAGYQVSYQFVSDAPEPASWLLVVAGGLLAIGWRKRLA